jgi:hypothetical protein
LEENQILRKDIYENIIRTIKLRRMRWARHVASIEKKKGNAYRILVGKPERNRSLGRYRHRWEKNYKMNLKEIEWCGMN